VVGPVVVPNVVGPVVVLDVVGPIVVPAVVSGPAIFLVVVESVVVTVDSLSVLEPSIVFLNKY